MSDAAIRIDVTQDDIDDGHPRESECCPVALALNRTMPLPWKWNVGVRPARAWLREPGVPVASVLVLPPRVDRFISRFDRGETVKPFSFEIVA